MNENLNLVEILKDCPEGTKLYSPLFGDVEFIQCNHQSNYPILVKNKNGGINGVTSQGKAYANFDGECVLFPSKDQRDWSKFEIGTNVDSPKFNPKTFKPFDKVLSRNPYNKIWSPNLFSYFGIDGVHCVSSYCDCYLVVPYNEDTEYLVGTTDEAPEFYRYWED